MKKTFKLLASLLLGLMISSCQSGFEENVEPNAEEVAITRVDNGASTSIYFKTVPNTKEWASFKTNVEKLNASQLPENLLSRLSTEDLVKACLDYPFAYSYSVGTNERDEIAYYISKFNGLSELSKRQDAISALVECYQKMAFSPGGIIEGRTYNVSLSFTLGYLELIMANSDFIQNVSTEDLNSVKTAAREKYLLKLEHPEYFGLLSIKRSLMLCSEIALIEGKIAGNENLSLLQDFAHNYENSYESAIEQVSRLVMQ